MTETSTTHQVDVSVRAVILRAAQARLAVLQDKERARDGVAHTTMADVARHILVNWKPAATAPDEDEDGTKRDRSGTRITTRGHRKFEKDKPAIRERPHGQASPLRAAYILSVVDKAVEKGDTNAVAILNEAHRVIKAEDLRDITLDGTSLHKHWQRARRQLLPPLRFTMAQDRYERVAERLNKHRTTVTRALEVGMTEFAKTGKLED